MPSLSLCGDQFSHCSFDFQIKGADLKSRSTSPNFELLNYSKTCLTKEPLSLLSIRTCITLLPSIMGIIVQVNSKLLYVWILGTFHIHHMLTSYIYCGQDSSHPGNGRTTIGFLV